MEDQGDVVTIESVKLCKDKIPLSQHTFEQHLNYLLDDRHSVELRSAIAKLLINTLAKGNYVLKGCSEFADAFRFIIEKSSFQMQNDKEDLTENLHRLLWEFYSNLLVERPELQSASWKNHLFL